MFPIASDIKSFIIRFLRVVLNSTLLPKHCKGDDLDCGRRRITGLPPPAGSLSAALIAIAVTGQEYHCRLRDHCDTGCHSLFYGRMGSALHLTWPSFIGAEKISKQKYFAFTACLQVVLAHPPRSLSFFRSVN